MQRFFDIVFSAFALVILSPLFLFIIIILRITGEGEIFYLQERVGKNGNLFIVYKFATMLKNSSNLGTGTVTIKGDPRILPIGGILRKTKINELPQLLNVFFGEMSIIGPRPLTKETFGYYPEKSKKVIENVRPGLSGIGSIVFRGEENIMSGSNATVEFYKTVIAPYKAELEEWYVFNRSIYIYFSAIFLTVLVVLNLKTELIWQIFKNLPKPPNKLENALNYKIYD